MATVLNDVLPYDNVVDGDVRERLATTTLRTALLLGLAGDLLLRGGGLGVNALLLSLMMAASVYALDQLRGDGATHARLVLLAPVVGAGVVLSWRGSEMLAVSAVLWCVIGLALHAQALRTGPSWSPWRLDVLAPLRALLRLGGDAATQGALLLGRDVPMGAVPGSGGWRSLTAGWRGMLVAVPVLLVLNAMLMSADPIWEKAARRLVDLDLEAIFSHVMVFAILAWLAAGWLRGSLLGAPPRAVPPPATHTVRAVDVLLPMTLVNLLFAGFVALQVRTLVGGAEYVKAAAGLTFAEYARRGFFELMWVAVLTLPALLLADALTPLDHRAQRAVRRGTAVTLALLGGILVSAAGRMVLYTEAYGLTQDRFYASAVMGWLAVVLAWFAATVLRGHSERFIGGAMASAWVVWALLAAANPEAIIARVNTARIAEGRSFDAAYVSRLGTDAAPAVVTALAAMPSSERCQVRRALALDAANRRLRLEDGTRDWRAASVGGWRAERAWRRAGISSVDAARRCPTDSVEDRAVPRAGP